MKLLFDANLSPKLVRKLKDLFPGSTHLFELSLPRDAPDFDIWTFAKENGFDIVTADRGDYLPLIKRLGPPPKIILLDSWRFPTKIAVDVIRGNAILIAEFERSDEGLLVLRT